MYISKQAKTQILLYIGTVAFWLVFVFISGYRAHPLGLYFQIPLFVIPFVGGINGLLIAQRWGGTRSIMGIAVGSISLGILSWSIGMLIWLYYIFIANVEIPYPSFADVGFSLSVPLWIYGVLKLSKASGAQFGLKYMLGKIQLVVLPIIVAVVSYFLLYSVARDGVIDWDVDGLHLFFDLFYPFGDLTILTVVVTVYSLSIRFLGGKYKMPILMLLLGFVLMYISDFTFSYTTTKETYFNGHFVDFLFVSTMFLLSFSVTMLDPGGKKGVKE